MAKQQKKQSTFQKLYKSLSASQKSLFAMYRQMSVCLALPGNQKICDCISAFYAEAQSLPEQVKRLDEPLPSERSEQEEGASQQSEHAAG